MAHPHLAKDLETLKGELKVHLSAVPFELDQVTHLPSKARPQILRPEHEGCDLGSTYSIAFGLGIDLSTWGKPIDIFDWVDRMAAYALRLLEKYAQQSLAWLDFQLFSSLPAEEIYAVVDDFRTPVQIDYKG